MLKTSLIDSWSFFSKHYVALAMIILPVVVPVELFYTCYTTFIDGASSSLPMVLTFLTYPLYAIAVVFYIHGVIAGHPQDTKSLWQLGLRYWAPYLSLCLLIGLMIMAGLILLVVPAIILGVRFAFAEFELLLNNLSPTEALKRSWRLTQAYFWPLLGGYAVMTAAIYIPLYVIGALAGTEGPVYWVVSTLLSILFSVLSTLYTIFAFRMYDFVRSEDDQAPATETPI